MDRRAFLAFGVAAVLTVPIDGAIAVFQEFSETERSWLADHPRIRLAPDPDFPPSSFCKMGNSPVSA